MPQKQKTYIHRSNAQQLEDERKRLAQQKQLQGTGLQRSHQSNGLQRSHESGGLQRSHERNGHHAQSGMGMIQRNETDEDDWVISSNPLLAHGIGQHGGSSGIDNPDEALEPSNGLNQSNKKIKLDESMMEGDGLGGINLSSHIPQNRNDYIPPPPNAPYPLTQFSYTNMPPPPLPFTDHSKQKSSGNMSQGRDRMKSLSAVNIGQVSGSNTSHSNSIPKDIVKESSLGFIPPPSGFE
ncbi:MAG: hypothetical protein AAF639_17420, partial [Chloroflexota bacterium]